MKTRSNMPLFVVACSNIKQLTDEQINMLRCGDWVVKKTGNQEHAYKVTFKSPTGICLTYHDASVIETQSYDLVNGNWVYNSEDKTPNLLDAQTENDVKALVEGGTLENAKPLYFHPIFCTSSSLRVSFIIINNSATPFTNMKEVVDYFRSLLSETLTIVRVPCTGGSVLSEGVSSVIASQINITSDVFRLYGLTTLGAHADYDLSSYYSTSIAVQDGVNKIN